MRKAPKHFTAKPPLRQTREYHSYPTLGNAGINLHSLSNEELFAFASACKAILHKREINDFYRCGDQAAGLLLNKLGKR